MMISIKNVFTKYLLLLLEEEISSVIFSLFANRDAPTTMITAPILMNKAYGSTVWEINLSSTHSTYPSEDTTYV